MTLKRMTRDLADVFGDERRPDVGKKERNDSLAGVAYEGVSWQRDREAEQASGSSSD